MVAPKRCALWYLHVEKAGTSKQEGKAYSLQIYLLNVWSHWWKNAWLKQVSGSDLTTRYRILHSAKGCTSGGGGGGIRKSSLEKRWPVSRLEQPQLSQSVPVSAQYVLYMQGTLIMKGSHMGMKASALMHEGCWKGWCSYKDSQLQALSKREGLGRKGGGGCPTNLFACLTATQPWSALYNLRP